MEDHEGAPHANCHTRPQVGADKEPEDESQEHPQHQVHKHPRGARLVPSHEAHKAPVGGAGDIRAHPTTKEDPGDNHTLLMGDPEALEANVSVEPSEGRETMMPLVVEVVVVVWALLGACTAMAVGHP